MANLSVFAGEFDGSTIRVTEDGQFSVYDVLVAFKVTDKAHAQETLKRIQDKYPEVNHFCVNFKFPGRGQRNTPVATEEGIYQILMLCPGKRGAEFRGWAAKIVRERREEESNPELAYTRGRQRAIDIWKRDGHSDDYIATRLKGIETRLQFTETLKRHGVTEGRHYALITNEIYLALYDATAAELKEEMGLSKKDNFRDHCSDVATAAHWLAELMAKEDIQNNDRQGFEECRDATRNAGNKVRRVFE